MKKIIIFLVTSLLAMSVNAQKMDATVTNGVINMASNSESNFRTFSLDICPLSFGYNGQNFMGLYVQNDELYSKNETEGWTSRMTQFQLGLVFNNIFGYNRGWYFKFRVGYAWTRTRTESTNYFDLQKDQSIIGSANLSRWSQDHHWLSRHQLQVGARQPIRSSKDAYYNDVPLDSASVWDIGLFRAKLTETFFSTFIDRQKDWTINADVSIGYGMEHNLVYTSYYPRLSVGISIFKVPYFYQNMIEIGFETQFFPSQPRYILVGKINLIPLLFAIWQKENIQIGGK